MIETLAVKNVADLVTGETLSGGQDLNTAILILQLNQVQIIFIFEVFMFPMVFRSWHQIVSTK